MPPKITITCDCGAARQLAYGERYRCECGRSWSTDGIPPADYARIRELDRRYRVIGWSGGLALAGLVLLFILTNPIALLAGIPGTMMIWFGFVRPRIRRRHWLAVQALTRSWQLKPERGGS